jgi:hypothetical protein
MYKKPLTIKIDNIDKIGIYSSDPILSLKSIKEIISEEIRNELKDQTNSLKSKYFNADPKSLKFLDIISKVITILSSIGIITFIIMLLIGKQDIGSIKVSSLLTIISFTLVGGFISIGGVKLFSINASLRKNNSRIDKYLKEGEFCPFLNVFDNQPHDNNWKTHRPGNPDFCIKCPLSIDTISDKERGFLIHNCNSYNQLHNSWLNTK